MSMINTQRLLKVPKDVRLRSLLRKEIEQLVAQKQLQPPVDFDRLQELALELIQQLGVDEVYLDFVIVLAGNEIWREVVAATPFERRLLLLPQCLKNANSCQGEMDELGLLCAGCKGCQIESVLSKAEALGYTTLVAEGTTVAVGLVEEGAIDAVIGVSCMPVLQRSFEPVSRAAVPVLGLPLLDDGCENTQLDYGWLFEEMHQLNRKPEKTPLSVSLLKDQVQDYFSDYTLQHFFQNQDETSVLAKEMLMRGGQRIRPLLTVLAYRSYASNPDDDIQARLALIIECFHKASLIHDDIEDDDDFRYEQKNLHKTHGTPIAINVGDYLVGKGYQLLADLKVAPFVLSESLKIVANSHLTLAVGQGADLALEKQNYQFSVDELLTIFIQKTGEAVKVALLLGAINGGASQEDQKTLRQFADWFGIAYQIRDDLNEFRDANQQEHLHHFPFLMALLRENHPEYASNGKPEIVHQLLINKEVDKHAEAFLELYVNKCYHELDRLQNLKLRLSLYGVMGKIF
ncbi:Geranylgeranyl pyrophosphate synthase [Sunxiuqinia elliptica]|uniref:Geranylgeranyl pyrophosphate synthase n=2 Tax=Sunxiuqinia elliptica TaxID=655355 RepID=A0A1I2LBP8_9BACT|nr:Geranylgeranyl pyrophosphate synthase [Sunxiuqinia elliptica]